MKVNELRILIQEIIAEEIIAEAANEVKPDDVEFKFDPIEAKIKEMLFSNGAYLDGNLRVEKKISPIQRKARLNNVLKQLEAYILYFKTSIAKQEDSFIADKEKYNKVWSDGNTSTNEGFFRPSEKDIANFETELEALIKEKGLENAPNLEKMKTDVRAIAKTSKFKGGKLGYQTAQTNKRTGNKIPPQFYYSTDSTTTGR